MLYKFLHWPDRHPKIWRAYQMFCLCMDFLSIIVVAWAHDMTALFVFCGMGLFTIWAIHRKDRDDDDDQDEEDDDPDWPDGDVVDRYLKSSLRIVRK